MRLGLVYWVKTFGETKQKGGIAMKCKNVCALLIAAAMLFGVASNVWALASEDIVLTVTIQILSVDVEDAAVAATWGLGLVVPSTTCQSWQAAPVAYVAAPASWQDGVDVENDGNGQETMGLQVVCTSGGLVWTNDKDADNNNTEAQDEYVYRALFDTAGSIAGATLGAEDQVTTAALTKADAATIYTDGNADAQNMAPTDVVQLFVEFVLPSGTAEAVPTQKTLTLTISAETVF
jgi:hypothetical protein